MPCRHVDVLIAGGGIAGDRNRSNPRGALRSLTLCIRMRDGLDMRHEPNFFPHCRPCPPDVHVSHIRRHDAGQRFDPSYIFPRISDKNTALELWQLETILEGPWLDDRSLASNALSVTHTQADAFVPQATAFYSRTQVHVCFSRSSNHLTRIAVQPSPSPPPPSQSMLPVGTFARPCASIHIFSSSDDASAFRSRSRGTYDWFVDDWPASESETERAREGWSAPHGFARIKALRVDVALFLRQSLAAFGEMGAFEKGTVAQEDIVTRPHQYPIVWNNMSSRCIVWAIGEQSPSLSAFHRPLTPRANKRGGSNSSGQAESIRPLLRRTFGCISVLRCPGLHTRSSLHFDGKWVCPAASFAPDAPSSGLYLAGSSYSPSSAAALDAAPGIIASLLPLLPAPPQLIRFKPLPLAVSPILSPFQSLSSHHRLVCHAAPALEVA
jgi:hypothetical protein